MMASRDDDDDNWIGDRSTLPALPPGHHICKRASGALALFLILALGVVPALVLVAVETSNAYYLLFLGEVLLAISALEWSWLAFRIRRKLLFTLHVLSDTDTIDAPTLESQQAQTQPLTLISSNSDHVQDATTRHASDCIDIQRPATAHTPPPLTLVAQRKLAMRATHFAIAPLAAKLGCGGRHWVACAIAIATATVCTVLAAVYGMERAVFRSDHHAIGWHMLVASTAAGMFVAAFAGCLAPTALDGVAIAVVVGCFVASSMNSFLMYYAQALAATELLDPLFIVLVGACAMIVMRVTTSTRVVESLLLVLCDISGLVFIGAPMLAAADLVDHPGASQHRDQLARFVVVVAAAETGDWLARQLVGRSCSYSTLPCCRRPTAELKTGSMMQADVAAFVGAVTLGALMLPLSLLWSSRSWNQSLDVAEALVLVLVLVVAQLSRRVIASIKDVADVTTTGFYLPSDTHVGGVLDRLVVFLVAVVVYHPYYKHVVYR